MYEYSIKSEERESSIIKTLIICVFIFLTCLVCCSCGSTKVVSQTVRDVSVDTVYLSNVQYDSIYIYQAKLIDRSRDTLYIKDKSIEYRYKLLRDTVRLIERDSIPYEVTITEVKEMTRPLTWFDHLTRLVFWFVFGYLISILVFKLKSINHKP